MSTRPTLWQHQCHILMLWSQLPLSTTVCSCLGQNFRSSLEIPWNFKPLLLTLKPILSRMCMTKNFVLFAYLALHESCQIPYWTSFSKRTAAIHHRQTTSAKGIWLTMDNIWRLWTETEKVSCHQGQCLQTAEAFFWAFWQNLRNCERHSPVHKSWFSLHSIWVDGQTSIWY